jgi:hypothetical protein
LSRPVQSAVLSRWERKANAAASSTAKTPNNGSKSVAKTPKSAARGDRFIPSRGGMNSSLSMHGLQNNENENPADGTLRAHLLSRVFGVLST